MNKLSRLKASSKNGRTQQNQSSSSSSSSSTTPVTSSGSSIWRPAGFSASGLRRRRSASSIYLFAHPLSESLRTLDLVTVSRGVRDWRTLPGVKPTDGTEELVVERLLELERLQCQTVEQERAARRLKCFPSFAVTNSSSQRKPTATSITNKEKKPEADTAVNETQGTTAEICRRCLERHVEGVESCMENAYLSRSRFYVPPTTTTCTEYTQTNTTITTTSTSGSSRPSSSSTTTTATVTTTTTTITTSATTNSSTPSSTPSLSRTSASTNNHLTVSKHGLAFNFQDFHPLPSN